MAKGWEDHGRILLFMGAAFLDLLGFALIRGRVEDLYIPSSVETISKWNPHSRKGTGGHIFIWTSIAP